MESIADYSETKVFASAVVLPIVTILTKRLETGHCVSILRHSVAGLNAVRTVPQEAWLEDPNVTFNIDLDTVAVGMKHRIEQQAVPLETLATVKFGIKLYETGKGVPAQTTAAAEGHVYESHTQVDNTYRPYLEGKDIGRFAVQWQQRWLKYGANLAAPRDPNLFQGERVLVRRIVGQTLMCSFTDSD